MLIFSLKICIIPILNIVSLKICMHPLWIVAHKLLKPKYSVYNIITSRIFYFLFFARNNCPCPLASTLFFFFLTKLLFRKWRIRKRWQSGPFSKHTTWKPWRPIQNSIGPQSKFWRDHLAKKMVSTIGFPINPTNRPQKRGRQKSSNILYTTKDPLRNITRHLSLTLFLLYANYNLPTRLNS